MRCALVLAALLTGSLAGCVSDKASPAASSSASDLPTTTVASTALAANDSVPAPVWKVGTAFGHHVFFGADDAEGEHYNTIVTRDDGGSYFLASDDEAAAKDEAAFDLPILGPVRKTDLHVSGLGGEWDFFKFPMKDGLTWTSTLALVMEDFEESWELTHVAKFNPGIQTPFGPRPGFDIEAHTEDHERIAAYDYVPDLGWYAHLFVYDVLTPEEGDFFFHVMSVGREEGWTGTYYAFDTVPLLQIVAGMAPNLDDLTTSFVEPNPYAAFTMEDGSTLLFGFLVAVAVAGAHEMALVDPNGEHHEVRALGTPAGDDYAALDLPSVAGEWRLVSAGAAAAWIEVAYLWQFTAAHGEL